MDEPQIITATEASRAFSDLLHRVCYGKESFVIKKGNRLMARILPVEMAPGEPAQPEAAPQVQAAPATQEEGLTAEEAAYYQTVVEQLRKMVPESCE